MSLAKKFYFKLVTVLKDIHELEVGASLVQADYVIAQRFGISESTARNWRRGRTLHISPPLVTKIVQICSLIAPQHTSDLEFIGRLSNNAQEVKLAADALVDELDRHIFTQQSNWHIYSGPLKFAFDPNYEQDSLQRLMVKSSMVTERILELGVDQNSIPSISELIRYSMHGWHATGMLAIRAASLSNAAAMLSFNYIGRIEAALYMGDGCGGSSFLLGDVKKARKCLEQAIALLDNASANEEKNSTVDRHDALIMLKAIEAQHACYQGYEENRPLIEAFEADFGFITSDNGWIDSIRQSTLGCIELARKQDYAKAADHFEKAIHAQDGWMSQFNVPFCSISPQSHRGYALLRAYGPTNSAFLQLSEGLLKTMEHGSLIDQIKARYCISQYYAAVGNQHMADFHQNRGTDQVRKYELQTWYQTLCNLLPSQ